PQRAESSAATGTIAAAAGATGRSGVRGGAGTAGGVGTEGVGLSADTGAPCAGVRGKVERDGTSLSRQTCQDTLADEDENDQHAAAHAGDDVVAHATANLVGVHLSARLVDARPLGALTACLAARS